MSHLWRLILIGAASVHAQSTLAATNPTAAAAFETGRAERVQSLHDPMLASGLPTYYSPGYERHAHELQRFVAGELQFVRREFAVDLVMSLAVLDATQWKRVEHQVPYPMPSVTGLPPVALMPASWATADHVFAKETEVSVTVLHRVGAHGLTWLPAVHRAFDLVGGHELGHTAIDAYGIVPGTRWLNEMLASYVLYAYLQHDRRDLLWLVDVLNQASRIDHPQSHVSLDDFESQYMTILTQDGDSYAWYQAQFLARIEQVYRHHGIGFLDEVRAAFPSGERRFELGNTETLARLERLEPGFDAWALSLRMQLPKHP
jgi:hypothetical protein